MINTVKNIRDNLNSPKRKVKYDPIVFSSQGYDSSACAVIGKKIKCTKAVTYESKKNNRSDNGKKIVKKLNYNDIIVKNELDYLNKNIAEEFVASGELGTSIFFAASEDDLKQKYLLSGIHGDKMWDKNCKYLNKDIIRSFYPDTAKKEFRLRTGFINITIPFLGVENIEQVNEISNSEEMKNWSLDNDYDRPIPRRIVEEAGVPRGYFGMEKSGGAGSNLRFGYLSYLEKIMPSSNFEEFNDFYETHKNKREFSFYYFKRSFFYSIYLLNILFKQKLQVNIIERLFDIDKWPRKYKCSPWAPSMLFHWGTKKLMDKYDY